eukprot:Pgem_evm1s5750
MSDFSTTISLSDDIIQSNLNCSNIRPLEIIQVSKIEKICAITNNLNLMSQYIDCKMTSNFKGNGSK